MLLDSWSRFHPIEDSHLVLQQSSSHHLVDDPLRGQ